MVTPVPARQYVWPSVNSTFPSISPAFERWKEREHTYYHYMHALDGIVSWRLYTVLLWSVQSCHCYHVWEPFAAILSQSISLSFTAAGHLQDDSTINATVVHTFTS